MDNLIDILELQRGGRLYSAALAWLLTPGGEHGLGRLLLDDLAETLAQQSVPWPEEAQAANTELEVRAAVRERRGRWDVVLVIGGDRVELLGGVPDDDELLYDLGAGRAVTCLLPPPDCSLASTASSTLVQWSWRRITDTLRRAQPHARHAQFLAELQEHLRERLAQASPPNTAVLSLAAEVEPAAQVASPPEESSVSDSDHQMILSEDMTRAYEVLDVLGEGGQGIVYDVRIKGNRTFKRASAEVRRAVLKLAREPKDDESILLEEAVYRTHSASLARFLDSGLASGRRYLVLERLYPLPGRWFAPEGVDLRLDLATAIDVYFALLQGLASLHFNKNQSLVLCDIKPDNILLRLSNDGRGLETSAYQRQISEGAYEPVFADLGCAQDRAVLQASGGQINTLIGTPYYLAPESVPTTGESGGLVPGRYAPAADVYALSLTFYHYLTGAKPLAHRGLDQMSSEEEFYDLLALKADGADPIDRDLLYRTFDGAVGKDLEQVLDLGLHRDPEQRASVNALLNSCRDKFAIQEEQAPAPLAADVGIQGLRFRQNRFPRLRVPSNVYRREARAATRRLQRRAAKRP